MRLSVLTFTLIAFASLPFAASCSSGSASTGGGGGVGITGVGGIAGTSNPTGGANPGAGFPTQPCIDQANGLLAQMTLDEKAAQTIQAERAQITNAQVTQYGVGSVYSQGGSAPAPTRPPAGRRWSTGIARRRGRARTVFRSSTAWTACTAWAPSRARRSSRTTSAWARSRDPDLVEQIARVVAEEIGGRGRRLPVRAHRRRLSGRALGTDLGGLRGDAGSRVPVGVRDGERPTIPDGRTKISILANLKHYLGDGGTANGVTGGPVTGDEATLRALHLAPYWAGVAAHAGSVMLSYSSWQGVNMHVNKPMITDVLKGEMSFGGFVVTDYNGCFQVGIWGERRARRRASTPARTCS